MRRPSIGAGMIEQFSGSTREGVVATVIVIWSYSDHWHRVADVTYDD
jgi:hypothetical protein